MVIVGLLTAGFGLALDAYNERQLAKDQRDATVHHQSQGMYMYKERQKTELTFRIAAGVVSLDASRRIQEAEAFRELQDYADFQSVLSNKVLDELEKEDMAAGKSFSEDEPYNTNTQYWPHQNSVLRNRLQPISQARLPHPIIFPQQHMNGSIEDWPRAYAPSLMECGIDQQTFLNFIDSFNESLRLFPRIEAVNVGGFPSGIGWGDAPMNLATAIPAAVRFAKSPQSNRSSNSFLGQANKSLFQARGLIAILITSIPDLPSQVIVIDSHAARPLHKTTRDVTKAPSPINHPDLDATSHIQPNSKLRQMSNFIADFHNKRPRWRMDNLQATMFDRPDSSNSSSHLRAGHTTTMNGPLSSILSVTANRTRVKDTDRRRRRRGSSFRPASRSDGTVSSKCCSTHDHRAVEYPPSEFKNGIIEESEADTRNARMSSSSSIQTGVLYLMIVNDSQEEPELIPDEADSAAMAYEH